MGNYWIEENEGDCFVLNRPDGSWMVLGWEEMKAVVDFMKVRRWKGKLADQVDRDIDEESLRFDTEDDRDDFLALCMEDIESRAAIYSDDFVPNFEDVVFDVAQENGVWAG